MPRHKLSATLVSLGLAAAIHTDWHFARPAHHQLSLGLSWHWLLAIPVFALAAWYVARAWPTQMLQASVAILAGGILVGAVLEPAFEYFFADATLEWAFGAVRNIAAATFVGTGLLAYVTTLIAMRVARPASPVDH